MLLFRMFGFRDLKGELKALPLAAQKRVLRKVARAGAGIIRKHYKKLLRGHRRTKSIEKSLGVIVRLYTDGNVTGYAGVKRKVEHTTSKGRRIVPGYYNHLLELGRKGFVRKLKTKNPPTPYANGKGRIIPAATGKYPLKKAIMASKKEVDAKIQAVFKDGLDKEIAKLKAKGK